LQAALRGPLWRRRRIGGAVTYFVSHTPQKGFWVVLRNDAGRYREVAKYRRREAAERAAAIFAAQQDCNSVKRSYIGSNQQPEI
jgi:hypothetical protein